VTLSRTSLRETASRALRSEMLRPLSGPRSAPPHFAGGNATGPIDGLIVPDEKDLLTPWSVWPDFRAAACATAGRQGPFCDL